MILLFDTETTGLPKNWQAAMTDTDNWPRVMQISWQVASFTGEVAKEYKTLIKPDGWVIPDEPFWRDNGYSTELCEAEGRNMEEVLDEFISDYNQCSVLAAHNINFDYNTLGAEMIRYKKKAHVKLPQVCTMQSSIDLCRLPGKYGYKYPKLEELHHVLFGEGFDDAHDSLADVNACRRCLFELINRGIITV